MENTDPIIYKGKEYPSAYIELDGIGTMRVSTISLNRALERDGVNENDAPWETTYIDEQIAYFLLDEEFALPISEVKEIVKSAYE